MGPVGSGSRWQLPIALGLGAGAAIAAVDNLMFEGEVSPIVIVLLLLVATLAASAVWGRRGFLTAFITWVWVPGAHVVKHAVGLPDTLHPNNYASIGKLGAFSFVVALVGTAFGVLLHRLVTVRPTHAGP